jgi:hypothetical protein
VQFQSLILHLVMPTAPKATTDYRLSYLGFLLMNLSFQR